METSHSKPKKKPTKLEDLTKEQIRQAILKKRECNTKALRIVESLLERDVTDIFLLQCLPHINQTHFDDIIEERSIAQTCGYPICQKPLSVKDIPKQKYRISLKTNKVYDITARKSFCSNSCYNAAMHVKKQLLTSPLWFREYEDIPKFELHRVDKISSMGEEVDVALVERVKVSEKKPFTTINDFAKASLNDMSNEEVSSELTNCEDELKSDGDSKTVNSEIETIENISKEIETKCKIKNSIDSINISMNEPVKPDLSTVIIEKLNKEKSTIDLGKPNNKMKTNPLNIVGEIIERPEKKIDPILLSAPLEDTKKQTSKKVPQKKQPLVTALTIEVEKCLAEWFTLDTMLLLFGEEKVREMVTDKGESIKEYLNNYAQGIICTSIMYDQYQALCKKLNMLEIEDRKFDSGTMKRETKPLPDYRMLQEESKKMQLKVKAFFSGETQIPETIIEENKQIEDTDNLTNLPLVDKNSQNALRRQIVCEHLNKVLPDLLRSLGLLCLTISSDVRLLINTFKLKANNIMFKPIQWTLIAIIVIKLLSLRDKRLEFLLEQPTAYEHMQLLLLSYKQDGGYLDRLICWLTDIDRLLDTNDTQLTIE